MTSKKLRFTTGFEVEVVMAINEYIEAVYQYIIWCHMDKHNSMYVMESDFIYTTNETAMRAGVDRIKQMCHQTIDEINSVVY